MYTSILFDLDGTLTDPREGILNSVRFALNKAGFDAPPAEKLTWVIGPPLRESFATIVNRPLTDKVIDELMSGYRERFAPIGLYENRVFPEIPLLLKRFKEHHIECFVATSKPEVYAREIIRHFDLNPYFTDICGSELDGTRENKAEVIGEVLRRFDLEPAKCLMVGDRKYDIHGAKAHNIDSVGVLYGAGSRAELEEAGPTHLIENPLQLLQICGILQP